MKITIPGNPLPQARMRLYKCGKRNLCYDPNGRDKALIKRYLKKILEEKFPDYKHPKCPKISFIFYMPIPKFTPKYKRKHAEIGALRHIQKPDVDNLVKLYLDCINEILIHDDSQVHIGYAAKFYHAEPRTIIEIEDVPELIYLDLLQDAADDFLKSYAPKRDSIPSLFDSKEIAC